MDDQTRAGRVAGKVALITGAAQGMGASHARVLAAEGARVAVADVAEPAARELVAEIDAAHGEGTALFVPLDVTDEAAWRAALAAVLDRFGGLDVLVNNAGIFTRGSVEAATLEDWRRTIDIDLTGNFIGMHVCVDALKRSGRASIINISSIAGLTGFKNRAAYSAAKWGVQGLTKTSALDLGEYGIRVNSVHPGSVRTPLTAGLERGFDQVPLGRDADPVEISQLILYLASDEAAYVSGASIAIDGGETAGNHLRQDG